VLIVPTYYDPETLAPPANDGNRLVLVALKDCYVELTPASFLVVRGACAGLGES